MATIVTDAGVFEVSAVPLKGTLLLREDELPDVTGWELNDQGLCRGDVCVTVRAHPEIREEDMVNLTVFADLVRQPLAFDAETETAVLGASAATRSDDLAGGRVGDLVLHDADGETFAWSEIGRKKKVLVTWASW
jgi:hypothetical protein